MLSPVWAMGNNSGKSQGQKRKLDFENESAAHQDKEPVKLKTKVNIKKVWVFFLNSWTNTISDYLHSINILSLCVNVCVWISKSFILEKNAF